MSVVPNTRLTDVIRKKVKQKEKMCYKLVDRKLLLSAD